MARNLFVTCAVTGSSPMPAHPDFLFRPDHVAAAALAVADAGASIIHVDVGDRATGDPSQAPEDYREVVGLIRAKNDELILNVMTGRAASGCRRSEDPAGCGPGTLMFTAERRLEHILNLKPDMCTLDICTMQLWGGMAINLDPMITKMGHMIQDAGVLPEIECFEAGAKYSLPATPEAMLYAKNQIPRGAQFTGFGVSRHSLPMAAQSILLGGNIWVGFEDTIYLRRGRMAANNAEMVHMVDHVGGDIANAGGTRAMLGLKQ